MILFRGRGETFFTYSCCHSRITLMVSLHIEENAMGAEKGNPKCCVWMCWTNVNVFTNVRVLATCYCKLVYSVLIYCIIKVIH